MEARLRMCCPQHLLSHFLRALVIQTQESGQPHPFATGATTTSGVGSTCASLAVAGESFFTVAGGSCERRTAVLGTNGR